MARRRNSVAKRFIRMRGLPVEEKILLQRLGNLMDAALNNRQASNPFENSRNKQHVSIHPPTNLLTKISVRSVKVVWDASDSNQFLRYEVVFTNLTTGVTTTKSSYTSEVIFKGEPGRYFADVKTIGRDGSISPIKRIEFTVGEDVQVLEGAKNGALELGTLVQDNIQMTPGHSIFAWGSEVLDRYQGHNDNDEIVFELWSAPRPDASISDSDVVLREQITLYPGTVSAACIDDTAQAGLITRPAAIVDRPGSFETSQAVMFSPIAVEEDEEDLEHTFFLKAINRLDEDDEVCLSLVLWSGSIGIGDSVPSDPFTPEPAYVFPHHNSFRMRYVSDTDTRWAMSYLFKEFSLVANQWTFAIWFKWGLGELTDVDERSRFMYSRHPMVPTSGTPAPPAIDNRLRIISIKDTAPLSHRIQVQIGPYDHSTTPNQLLINYGPHNVSNAAIGRSPLYTFGEGIPSAFRNDGWHFFVWVYEGGGIGGTPKLRFYRPFPDTGGTTSVGDSVMTLLAPTGGSVAALTNSVHNMTDGTNNYHAFGVDLDSLITDATGLYSGANTDPDSDAITGSIGDLYLHQAGFWNVALDNGPNGRGTEVGAIEYLYNTGRGTEINWKENEDATGPGVYLFAQNLVHLWQFGAIEAPFTDFTPLRDTGNYLRGGGDVNFTRLVQPTAASGTNVRSWSNNTSIADVYSPEGLNGTTQSDEAYPGQNL